MAFGRSSRVTASRQNIICVGSERFAAPIAMSTGLWPRHWSNRLALRSSIELCFEPITAGLLSTSPAAAAVRWPQNAQIGQPHIFGPCVAADRDRMTAAIIHARTDIVTWQELDPRILDEADHIAAFGREDDRVSRGIALVAWVRGSSGRIAESLNHSQSTRPLRLANGGSKSD